MREPTESASSPIVHGGGHIARQKVIRPKARLFGFLSIIWLPLSVIGSMIWWTIGAELPAAAWLLSLCFTLHRGVNRPARVAVPID